jgi:hypothetical protein
VLELGEHGCGGHGAVSQWGQQPPPDVLCSPSDTRCVCVAL